MRTRGLVAVCAVLAVFSAAALGQEYSVKLDRPARAGQVVNRATTVTGTLHILAREGSTILDDRTTTYTIDYAAEVTVLEVDSTGNVTRDTHRITTCKRVENDVTTEYFQPGTVVTASLDNGQEVFFKEGKPVTPQQAAVLGTLITLGSYGPSEDDVFGTIEPRRVGDAWAVNVATLVADLAGDMPRTPSYTGAVRLLGVVSVGGVDCLELRAEISNPTFAPVAPRGIAVVSGASFLRVVSDYPLDASLPMLKRQMVYSADFQTYSGTLPGTGQQARAVTVDTHYEKATNTTLTVLRP